MNLALIMLDNVHIHVIMNIIVTPSYQEVAWQLGNVHNDYKRPFSCSLITQPTYSWFFDLVASKYCLTMYNHIDDLI